MLTIVLVAVTATAQAQPKNFRAHLRGSEEVPRVDTRAQGKAVFRLSADGTELHFRLIVANIENLTQAHIHRAAAGTNGPIVVWLYPDSPPAQLIPGRFNGVLVEGVITEANLVGQLAGEELSALIEELEAGNAYVNVHTSQFPGGEVRGQVRQPLRATLETRLYWQRLFHIFMPCSAFSLISSHSDSGVNTKGSFELNGARVAIAETIWPSARRRAGRLQGICSLA